jgi:hypothetical protein
LLALLLAGCLDANGIKVFQVSIVNDTQQTVVVRDCDSFCSSSPIAINLQPGASAPINRIAGEHKLFSVTSATGAHIGCLDLYYASPHPGASADVSRATPCPGSSSHRNLGTAGLIAVAVLAVALAAFLVLRRLRLRAESRP